MIMRILLAIFFLGLTTIGACLCLADEPGELTTPTLPTNRVDEAPKPEVKVQADLTQPTSQAQELATQSREAQQQRLDLINLEIRLNQCNAERASLLWELTQRNAPELQAQQQETIRQLQKTDAPKAEKK
jgi:hypothetical protein